MVRPVATRCRQAALQPPAMLSTVGQRWTSSLDRDESSPFKSEFVQPRRIGYRGRPVVREPEC